MAQLRGCHHITRDDYDIEKLITCIKGFQDRYGLKVYLEPGEAVALNTGFLVATVLDLVDNGIHNAILDTSAACHMPDAGMPYRPNIIGAALPDEKRFTYRLGGPTCLAGDIIMTTPLSKLLKIEDRLVFCDMAIYSMVKNQHLNGMNLPAITILSFFFFFFFFISHQRYMYKAAKNDLWLCDSNLYRPN